jgi:hypothetical protein
MTLFLGAIQGAKEAVWDLSSQLPSIRLQDNIKVMASQKSKLKNEQKLRNE